MEKTLNANSKYNAIVDATICVQKIAKEKCDCIERVQLEWMLGCLQKMRKNNVKYLKLEMEINLNNAKFGERFKCKNGDMAVYYYKYGTSHLLIRKDTYIPQAYMDNGRGSIPQYHIVDVWK